jgi:putative transposase
LVQAFPFESAPRFLIRDRDSIYGRQVVETIRVLGIEQKIISYESPWMNGYVERVIGSIRRECLDHVIVFGERHLRRVLRECVAYYHGTRAHLGLGKDAPEPRAVQPRGDGPVVSAPVLGSLHHRYWRKRPDEFRIEPRWASAGPVCPQPASSLRTWRPPHWLRPHADPSSNRAGLATSD